MRCRSEDRAHVRTVPAPFDLAGSVPRGGSDPIRDVPENPMARLPRTLLAACLCTLVLGACGDDAPTETTNQPDPEPKIERMKRPEGGNLLWRDDPLAVGMTAPAVAGLPEGQYAVLVFYRGRW